MAYGNAAYRFDARPAYGRASQALQEVQAVRTGGTFAPSAPQPAPLLATGAKLAAVVLVVVALLSFGRIALTNEAVTIMIESDALSGQIAEARSAGVGLEMEQSVLANTSAVDAAVKRLGMTAPAEVGTIALSPDVVSIASDGSLSLSGTVENVVKSQG